jgi:multidrug resistance efflux pump
MDNDNQLHSSRTFYLGKTPFIVKHAFIFCLSIVVIIALLSVLVKLPEYAYVEVFLTKTQKPLQIYTKENSYDYQLKHKNGSQVKKGDTLIALKSNAEISDIKHLKEFVDTKLQLDSNVLIETLLSDKVYYQNLGILQVSFNAYVQNRELFKFYTTIASKNHDYLQASKKTNYINNYFSALNEQIAIAFKNLKLAEETFAIESQFEKDQIIAKEDLKKTETDYLRRKNEYYALLSAKSNLNNESIELQKGDLDFKEHSDLLLLKLKDNLMALAALIKDWDQQNVVRAPFAGKVMYNRSFNANRLGIEENIMTLDPYSDSIVFEGYADQFVITKLNFNQSIHIILSGYDKNEFGVLTGRIIKISDIPKDSRYLISIYVPNLTTTYNKSIPYKLNIEGRAEALVKNRNVVQTLVLDKLLKR